MKKSKILAWVLCVAMCFGLCTSAFAAGTTITGAQIKLNDNELELTGEAQSVTAAIDLLIADGETVAAAGMNYQLSLPEGWSVSSSEVPQGVMSSITNTAGMWILMSGTTDVKTLATLTLSIPANVEAGTYTISISDVKVSGAGNATLYSEGTASATLTITGGEPAPAESYTLTLAADKSEVKVDETFTVTATVSGAAFNGIEGAVTYDKTQFELTDATGTAVANTTNDGSLELYALENEKFADGTAVATLTFKALSETVSGTIDAAATAGDYDDFRSDANAVTVVAANVKVNPKTYAITVGEISNGTVTPNKTEAAAGETITLDVVPTAGYELETLTYTVEGGQPVDIKAAKSFTMPAANVTVNAAFAVTQVPWTTETTADYVSGITLVTVSGNSANGYTYDGNAMYKVGNGKFAYLVAGAADAAKVAEAAAAGFVDLSAAMANDVNGTGKVDFNDAGAAFGCYNKAYDVTADMAMYLRADVSGDGKVDMSDVNAILAAYK